MKKTLLAMLSVFAAWSLMDFVIHGIILVDAYHQTPQLWRPMAEMKTGLMYAAVFISAASFVLIYSWLIPDKSATKGVLYGLLFGLGTGISMGYGSYAVMPLPHTIAVGWFLGHLAEALAAGLITGLITKPQGGKSDWTPYGIRERWDYIKRAP